MPSRNRVVFVNGYPATGKTTFINRLRKEGLSCPIISKDEIKEVFYSHLDINNDNNGKELNNIAISLLFQSMAEHARAGTPSVIEANFKPYYDEQIVQDIVKTHCIKSLQIFFVADESELFRRDRERNRHGYRHKGHSQLNRATFHQQAKLVKNFDLPNTTNIVFNTQTSSDTAYDALLRHVSNFLEGC